MDVTATWLALAIGVIGGCWLAFVAGKAMFRESDESGQSEQKTPTARFAMGGAGCAFIPAFFLSFALGGFAGKLGAQFTQYLGLGDLGLWPGLAIGIAFSLFILLLMGAILGALVGSMVTGFRK